MELQRKWMEVFEIVNKANKEVKAKVEEIKNYIAEKYGSELDKIANDLNFKYELKVETDENNPVLCVPVLEITPSTMLTSDESYKLKSEVYRRMGEWGSQGRVKVIVKPFTPKL